MTKILFCNLAENIILHELIHIGILNDMVAILKQYGKCVNVIKKKFIKLKTLFLKNCNKTKHDQSITL